MNLNPNHRTMLAVLVVFILDQATKLLVLSFLGYSRELIVVDGFFKLVHWGNTGAAWSLFRDQNELLTIVSLVALLILFLGRRYFDVKSPLGPIAMGMVFGGVIGNILDRVLRGHVVDFLYFYIQRRSGSEIGFPAFNIADSAICIGIGMLFILSLESEESSTSQAGTA